jgi:hypothetical protein
MEIDAEWLNEALRAIRGGVCDKLTLGNITVYRVKNVIRIEIKDD